MTIQDVLELALGRPPSMPVTHPVYAPQMEMLAAEHDRYQLWRGGRFGPPEVTHFSGWFADKPEAAASYQAWKDAGQPTGKWTLNDHMSAIMDNTRAAMGLTSGR
ncbi:MAG: hypothetical protein RJA55_2317 [Acidobacteriota bacterium]|jgi:hypothetical protein